MFFIPLPIIKGTEMSLHDYKKCFLPNKYNILIDKRAKWLSHQLDIKAVYSSIDKCRIFASKIYEKGYSALDVLNYIHDSPKIDNKRKFLLLVYFDKIRKEFRNETILIAFIINVAFMRPDLNLENIEEM